MKFTAEVKGSSEVVKRLRGITPTVRSKLEEKIQRLTIQLQRHVVQDKLQGQVLNVGKTGRLHRSIQQAMISDQERIAGLVSTNVSYAAAHEDGYSGTVTVKEHLRTITQAFGKQLKEPVTSTVRSHSMKMNLKERSFLRSALTEMRPEILSEITAVITEVAKK
jgi:hypothetical protein